MKLTGLEAFLFILFRALLIIGIIFVAAFILTFSVPTVLAAPDNLWGWFGILVSVLLIRGTIASSKK